MKLSSDPEDGAPDLQRLLATVEELSGLEASVYSAEPGSGSHTLDALPTVYRRHMSTFCCTVKNSRDGQGCRGHDSRDTTLRAGEVRKPFVQICRAGVAEVIVPVMHGGKHLATINLGQVRTETVEENGFAAVWARLAGSGVDQRELRNAYDGLPSMTESRLLRLGQLLDAAIRGLAETLSDASFAREVRLQHAPAVRRAVDILAEEDCFDITEKSMAIRVHLSVSHFSRIFSQVMEQSFSEYILGLRIREAQRLLHQTGSPIGDIALRCGFSRQSYFTRRFRKVTGMTPSQYRNRHNRDKAR